MDSSDRLPKHLLVGFGLALALYAAFFTLDQYLRHRKGAWEVTFSTNSAGWASIEVRQPALKIHEQIVFDSERPTNSMIAGMITFDRPSKIVPFGKVKFEDLTYLPGSVAFDFFGHEVELLPRTLYLNKREIPWTGAVHQLMPNEKLPPEMSYEPRRRKRL